MPRKAKPKQIGVDGAIQEIKAFCEQSGLSINALARHSKVSQPALARFLGGERNTITVTARIVLKFIANNQSRHNWHNNTVIPDELQAAVHLLWDGRLQSVSVVASLIRALKPVLEMAAVSGGESNGGETQ